MVQHFPGGFDAMLDRGGEYAVVVVLTRGLEKIEKEALLY